MNIVSPISYHIPGQPICRKGCLSQSTPFYRAVHGTAQRIHDSTAMRLVHQTNKEITNALPLGPLHCELEQDALLLNKSGSSNILISKVSFDCLITEKSKKKRRDYLSFDLRIPGANPALSYDTMERLYGNQKEIYQTLRHFYQVGNSAHHKHGHRPKYSAKNPNQDQYIRHTEQMLAAYLALPQASQMLLNRLRAEIRGKYSNASIVKIYNIGLHMHSTKTCCAPCEFVLAGLMKERKSFGQKNKLGFFSNFERVCSISDDRLSVILSNRFQLLTTVTASQPDADHRKQPPYTEKTLKSRASIQPFDIFVKDPKTFTSIFEVVLQSHPKLPFFSNLTDKTVFISGSNATRGTKGTKTAVTKLRDREIPDQEIHLLPLLAQRAQDKKA